MEVALVNPRKSPGRKKSTKGRKAKRSRKSSTTANPKNKKRKVGAYQKRVGKFMKQGKTMKQAHTLAKGGSTAANPKRRKSTSTANPKRRKRKSTAANPKRRKSTSTTSNPRKRKSPKRVAAGKKAARTRKARMAGKRRSNPKRKARAKNLPAKRRTAANRKGYTSGYRYYKPSIGKYVKVSGHRRPQRNKSRKGKRRRNPSTATRGGFLPTFKRVKQQVYIMPKRGQYYPTWKEIKKHPVFTVAGFGFGGVSSAICGGVGRLIGGKNVLISEALGIMGNVLGFEVPVRLISLFNFKGKDVMVKSMRAGGLIVTGFSILLGIVRILLTLKKEGPSGLKPTKEGMGQIKLPKLTEVPKKVLKAVGLGVGLSDIVTSGIKQGYERWQPVGVSDSAEEGYDGLLGEDDYEGEEEGDVSWYKDENLGDPTLVDRIRKLQKDLGLSDAEVETMMNEGNGGGGNNDDEVLPGIFNTYVPKEYDGGMQRDYVM